MGLYTATIRYTGLDKIPIDIKSRDKIGMMFAPPGWSIINEVKAANRTMNPTTIKLAEDKYIYEYNRALDTRRGQAGDDFDTFAELLRSRHYTFTCFCGPNDFCHRHLAAFWMYTHYGTVLCGERS